MHLDGRRDCRPCGLRRLSGGGSYTLSSTCAHIACPSLSLSIVHTLSLKVCSREYITWMVDGVRFVPHTHLNLCSPLYGILSGYSKCAGAVKIQNSYCLVVTLVVII